MRKETMQKAGLLITAAAAVFLIFSISLFAVMFDKSFYDKSYDQYGTYDKVGVEGVRITTDALVGYLIGEDSNPDRAGMQAFSQSELNHLNDVHWIIRIIKYLAIISLAWLIWIIYSNYNTPHGRAFLTKLAKYTAYTGVITIFVLIILGLNFNWFFNLFHHVFFPQGNYTFPATSLLIIMFPQEFFRDFAIKMLIHSMVLFALIYLLGSKINWFNPNK